jgi:hypothetical protein
MRAHVKNQDTGSSRYYTILDFDGTVVGKGDNKAYILGSATTNWYDTNDATRRAFHGWVDTFR